MSQIIKSIVSRDGSINHILNYGKSLVECRYVRRSPKYISVYVSSHNGCKMKCKFCWLTQQNQNQFKHVDMDLFSYQVKTVLDSVPEQDNTKDKSKIRCNINFMSRGEPLANKNLILDYDMVLRGITNEVENHGYGETKMNISTIMPYTIKNKSLYDVFKDNPVNLYYSMYSIDDSFKSKWMPNAIHYRDALDKLKELQNLSSAQPTITIHGAFIKGENDNLEDIERMVDEIDKTNFKKIKFNIVKFNPHQNLDYEEADEETINKIYEKFKQITKFDSANYNTTRQVPRIGYDVFASCGMFIQDHDI